MADVAATTRDAAELNEKLIRYWNALVEDGEDCIKANPTGYTVWRSFKELAPDMTNDDAACIWIRSQEATWGKAHTSTSEESKGKCSLNNQEWAAAWALFATGDYECTEEEIADWRRQCFKGELKKGSGSD